MAVTPPAASPRRRLSATSVSGCALVLLLACGVAARQEAAARDVETEARAALAAIDGGLDTRDAERIVSGLRALEPIWADLSDKTRRQTLKSLQSVFARLKPREEYDASRGGLGSGIPGVDDDQPQIEDPREPLRRAYSPLVGLVFDKPEGRELLLGALKQPHVRDWPEMRALIVTGLGHREEPELLGTFADLLADDHAGVVSAAAEALGRYAKAPVELRRRAVAALVAGFSDAAKLAERAARKRRGDDPAPAEERFVNLQVAVTRALADLTRQSFEDPADWSRWFATQGKGSDW